VHETLGSELVPTAHHLKKQFLMFEKEIVSERISVELPSVNPLKTMQPPHMPAMDAVCFPGCIK
jgi:hypothetical protein